MDRLCCLINWTKKCVRCGLQLCKDCWKGALKGMTRTRYGGPCISTVSKNKGRKFKHHSWNGLRSWDSDILRARRQYGR